MTSLLTLSAVAPLVLALVPCLFVDLKTRQPFVPDTKVARHRAPTSVEQARAPWWKPAQLGLDNYS
jgi:hypothetical protein